MQLVATVANRSPAGMAKTSENRFPCIASTCLTKFHGKEGNIPRRALACAPRKYASAQSARRYRAENRLDRPKTGRGVRCT
jgi:hypothetical protein